MLLQEKMIQTVREKAEADARVTGLLMYGSFTQGAGDEFSDIEFYVFVEDGGFDAWDGGEWIGGIAPVAALFYNEFGTQVAVFDNLIRGEFHFLPASQVNTVEGFVAAGYFPDVDSMLLYDGDGKLTEAAACLRGVQPAFGKAEAEEIANNLLNYLLYGSNVLLRGEYARSLEVLFFAQRLYLQGIRLLENAAEHFINPNKNLEGEISEEAYRAYAGCTCGLDPAAISVAYANMLGEGKTLAAKLAERYGFDGHEALFGRVEAYFHAGGPEA